MVGLRCVTDLTAGARGERARLEPDVVVGVVEGAERAAVVGVADVVGQVLHERPAEGDVDQLHAAADAEDRQGAPPRAAGEGGLGGGAGPGGGWGVSGGGW